MLCCLIFSMLLGQAGLVFRRARNWLGLGPRREVGADGSVVLRPAWRLYGFLGAQAVALTLVVLNWSHLGHEIDRLVALASPGPVASPLCRGGVSAVVSARP